MAHGDFNPDTAPEEALKIGVYEQLQYSDYPFIHYMSSDRASSVINCSKAQSSAALDESPRTAVVQCHISLLATRLLVKMRRPYTTSTAGNNFRQINSK
jgi:hypothetical protein